MRNEKVVNWLSKRGAVDLNDPMTRIGVLGSLGSIRGVKRENVRIAIDAYARSKKDAIIDTKREREELALLITREANKNPPRVPFARAWGAGREIKRKRSSYFRQTMEGSFDR
jgi:RNase P/RNase MRP subunit POP5